MNIIGAVEFILNTIFTLYLTVVLLRLILQYVGAPFGNPIIQFIIKATNIGYRPLRRFIPGYKGIDFAGVVFALIITCLYVTIISLLKFNMLPSIIILIYTSIFMVIGTLLNIYFYSIIIRIIFSFIAMSNSQILYNPIYSITYSISEPILKPIKRVLPPTAGFDFSPLVACMGIMVIRILFGL